MNGYTIITRRDDDRPPPRWWYEVAVERADRVEVVHIDGFYPSSAKAHEAARGWLEANVPAWARPADGR